jgi:hypothetical protein
MAEAGGRVMADEVVHLRWIAVATYRSESGPIEVDHHFEELHTIIERGPHFDTIISIVVTFNPERAEYPDDTVEAAEQR